ncbi:MAG: hypothetical protein ACJ74Z_11235 [Bryobacteraceae bacterium]
MKGVIYMRHARAIAAVFVSGGLSLSGAVDPALLGLVPPGTKLVSGIQLDQARSSQFGRYLLNQIDTEDERFQQLTEETGFDPRRDLNEVLFATSGPGEVNTQPSFVVLARGSFDQNRIEAKAKAKGAAVETYQGVHLMLKARENHHNSGVAFLDGGIAVLADRATLRQIVAGRATPTVLDAALQDQVVKASAANDAWFASSMPGSYLTRHLEHETSQPMQHAQALQSILQSSGGVHFGDMVEFSLDASTRSPQDAVSLADVLHFGASMVQMQRQNDPRAAIVASAVDSMKITSSGPTLHATFSLTEKQLEELVAAGRRAGVAVSVDPGRLPKPSKP